MGGTSAAATILSSKEHVVLECMPLVSVLVLRWGRKETDWSGHEESGCEIGRAAFLCVCSRGNTQYSI